MATKADVRRLEAIVSNLEGFILDSGGEDRSHYKMDLVRFHSDLATGKRLLARIETVLERAKLEATR